MTHLLHRAANGVPPMAVGGKGIEIFDHDGRRYIDASGGAAVSCLGHGHPDVLAALHAQLDALAYAHTGFFTSEPAERLADTPDRGRAERPRPRLSRQRRLGGGRSGAENGAAIFRRDRRAAAPARHRAQAELSRQHAGRARRRRQRLAARAVPPAADRSPSHRSRATPIAIGWRAKARRPTRRARRRRSKTRSSNSAPSP